MTADQSNNEPRANGVGNMRVRIDEATGDLVGYFAPAGSKLPAIVREALQGARSYLEAEPRQDVWTKSVLAVLDGALNYPFKHPLREVIEFAAACINRERKEMQFLPHAAREVWVALADADAHLVDNPFPQPAPAISVEEANAIRATVKEHMRLTDLARRQQFAAPDDAKDLERRRQTQEQHSNSAAAVIALCKKYNIELPPANPPALHGLAIAWLLELADDVLRLTPETTKALPGQP